MLFRSLGDTFVDFFTGSLQAIADEVAMTATEHVVRDLVRLNFGPREAYPTIEAGNLAETENVSVATLTALTSAGLITPDTDTENTFRQRYGLPQKAETTNTDPENAVQPVEDGEDDPERRPVSSGPVLPAPAASADDARMARLEAILDRVERLQGGDA